MDNSNNELIRNPIRSAKIQTIKTDKKKPKKRNICKLNSYFQKKKKNWKKHRKRDIIIYKIDFHNINAFPMKQLNLIIKIAIHKSEHFTIVDGRYREESPVEKQ